MITILITLWFYGYDMTIDAREMYGIQTLSECVTILPQIEKDFGAHSGLCLNGDILNEFMES